jgi:fermentation-respiration switch protein FrsA (DUF1100 family)
VERVGLYGISMGGASPLLAAAEDPEIAAVAADCSFANLEEMVEQRFFFLPRSVRSPLGETVRDWVERSVGGMLDQVDPEAAVRSWRPRPLLVIHGERDLLTPAAHAKRLADAGGGQSELWIVPGAGHAAARRAAGRAYVERLARFFQRHLGIALSRTDML